MKAIVFVNSSWNIYNFRAGLVRTMQKAGFEIHALAPEDDYSVHLTAMGCIYHPVKIKNTGSDPLADLNLIRRIHKLYRRIKPQVILHYTVKPNVYGTMIAKWLGIPSISTVSGLGTVFLTSGKTSKIARFLYRRAFIYPAKIYFQNQYDLELFKNKGLLRRSNYDLIPGSGIDIKRFTRTTGPPGRPPFKFLMMARLIEEKGIREYIKAAGILRNEGLSVCCQLLGASVPDHKRGIPVREVRAGPVEYLGETSDVRKYIDSAHAIVLPSYREGLSRSLLEAAAMGKPIIASDVPGCKEVVKDQINGLLCKPGNAADLGEKMKKLQASSDERLMEMGNAGRDLVIENFREDQVMKIYLNTIMNII